MTSNANASICPNRTHFVESYFFDEDASSPLAYRKIPRIVHISSKLPCMSSGFRGIVKNWHLPNHSFAFHDDDAVDRLLAKEWPEFPNLHLALECLVSGAAKVDLWRYLVLYEYGGIYSDMDSAANYKFLVTEAIEPNDDAYLLIEGKGFLAQYFLSASPKHPIMFLAVHHTIRRLLETGNVLNQYVPFVTGPGALKAAGISFMNDDESFGYPAAGVHTGMDNRTVRVVGNKRTSNSYIIRGAIRGATKQKGYDAINQTVYKDFSDNVHGEERDRLDRSCLSLLQLLSKTGDYRY